MWCTCLQRCKLCHHCLEGHIEWYILVIIHVLVSNPCRLIQFLCIVELALYWPSHLGSSFLVSPRLWNGIVASIRILLSLTPILFFLFGASQFHIFCWFKTINWILCKLLIFMKLSVSFSVALSSSIITFLARVASFPSPGWRWGE